MITPFFSIIVPVYKVAEYLERCLESLEQQDIPKSDYEIICINDGSPDNCRAIIENFQKKYSNIILLNQENQGVSMARNNGIAIAKGTYILPIDADDFVVPNTFGRLVDLLKKLDCDALYLGFEIFDANDKSVWKTDYSNYNHQLFDGVEGYFQSRGISIQDPDRSWAIFYRKELLETFHIQYPKNVPYLEDGLFIAKVFAVAKTVSFDNKIFYQRTTRPGSAVNSNLFYSEKAVDGFISAIKDIEKFGQHAKVTGKQKELINHAIAKFVILTITPSVSSFDFKEYFRVLKLLKSNDVSIKSKVGIRMDYKWHSRIFNFSKIVFPFYFYLNKKMNLGK